MTLTTPPIADEPNSKADGAAQDLDPVGGQRVDRDRMVGARRGQIEAADAVGEDADAVAAKAAQDRARGGGAEAGGADPGLLGERLADARADRVGKLGALDHRDPAERVVDVAADPGDDDGSSSWRARMAGVGRRRRRGDGLARQAGPAVDKKRGGEGARE